ncbi:unnamed protein product [Spirodela intermedia]|uniref:Uncharacterized protein n=1 Tax=Spirodela intermedia TaxID=51605 RepID=A0A7I8L0T4_SPIIN|nr:unnamed protein product [Spirodela intermedia]
MKRGREDENVAGPLFPRLHVNDAGKGGLRAPPRNKMALYEIFSIPSHMLKSDSPSSAPDSLVPSASLNQGCGHEKTVPSLNHALSPVPSYPAEKSSTHPLERMNEAGPRTMVGRHPLKHGFRRIASTAGNHPQVGDQCSSLRPDSSSRAEDCPGRKPGDEDDFRSPTISQPGIALRSDKDHHFMDREKTTAHSYLNSLKESGSTVSNTQSLAEDRKPVEEHGIRGLIMQQHKRDSAEEKTEETVALTTASFESKGTRSTRCGSTGLRRWSAGSTRGAEGAGKESNGRTGFCSRELPGNSLMEPGAGEGLDRTGSVEDADVLPSPSSGDSDKEALEGSGADDEDSGTSMGSVPGIDISPDDVVDLIGAKHFWKMRRAIANQQRVFGIQVFELHKLIKVQKLLSVSPHVLLEDTSRLQGQPVEDPCANFLVKPQMKTIKEKVAGSNHLVEPQPPITNQRDHSQKAKCDSKSTTEDMAGILSFHRVQHPTDQASSLPVSSDSTPRPWCFQAPASNQWLVPVMSPSEGLIYKPCTSPYPPPAALMNTVYSGSTPLSLAPVAGKLMSPAYGVPVPHQQLSIGVLPGSAAIAPTLLPVPFGLPVHGAEVEQLKPIAGPLLKQHSWSSCGVSNPKSGPFSELDRSVQKSKGSILQGSTGSSPSDTRLQGQRAAVTPLPMVSEGSGQHTQVIKVVPHNPKSTTESAARIFQRIQRERQQYDSV